MKEMKVENLSNSFPVDHYDQRTYYYRLFQSEGPLSCKDIHVGNVLTIQEANFWKDSAQFRSFDKVVTYWPENIKTIKFKDFEK